MFSNFSVFLVSFKYKFWFSFAARTTVLELAAQYLLFLRSREGTRHDAEFALQKDVVFARLFF